MMEKNPGQRSLARKVRGRELAIVLAALLVVCILAMAIRAGVVDPMQSSQPDVVAKYARPLFRWSY